MENDPLVWHYGLMAEHWAEFNTDTPELEYFLREIARSGEPVLDLGCGTGRLLVPLLKSGIDIDGCDFSSDMLELCRRRAASEGFSPNLINASMHAFAAPRSYKTIYICGSFGLAGSRTNDLDTLCCCYTHLEDGGALILNIDAEYTSEDIWKTWVTEYCKSLPEPWPEEGSSKIASDGSERRSYFRMLGIDPVEQSYTRQVRLEKWVSGLRVAVEEYTLRGNFYLKPEVQLMLKVAGFRNIEVTGDYTDEPADPHHEQLIFRAVR